VEEVDWTSFYHCIRFPAASPSKATLEKTALDESMWRRQHREGPLDDRWGTLDLRKNEGSGDLEIIEARREFLCGAGRSQRTYYTTKLVFPSKVEEGEETTTESNRTGRNAAFCLSDSGSPPSSTRNGMIEKHTLAALTNDRLALTLRGSDNPHWLPQQIRLPKNVHSGDDGTYIISHMHMRYYNSSAHTFMDLINDPSEDGRGSQRLFLRAGSRKLDPPMRDSTGVLLPEATDPETGSILCGLNETYTAQEVMVWPRNNDQRISQEHSLEELYMLMNPLTHCGNVEVQSDDRSMVYATGGKEHPRALVFINFDPSIRLRGLMKWCSRRNSSEQELWPTRTRSGLVSVRHGSYGNACKGKAKADEVKWGMAIQTNDVTTQASPERRTRGSFDGSWPAWMTRKPAMYKDIARGFDFGF
jgi:hypothetical protein